MAHVLTLPRKADTVNTNEELAAMATSLGLPVQAQRYSAVRCIETDFQPLTPDESLIWLAFCPTSYASDCTKRTRTRIDTYFEGTRFPIAEYKYDTIPPEVLRHWHCIKQNYAFDSFQIRTTEKTQYLDPILIGCNSDQDYLLARWGLESPDSLPFSEVRAKLRQSMSENSWWMNSPAFKIKRGWWSCRVISRIARSPLAIALQF